LKRILPLRCRVENKNVLTPSRTNLEISLSQWVVLETNPEDHSDSGAGTKHGKETVPLPELFVFGQVAV